MQIFQKLGFYVGLAVFLLILIFIDLDPANPIITRMAAVACLMAVWWITEALPLAATSLIPIIAFPLLGILDGEKTAGSYINSVIFLFLGGFLLALAMENWGLHKRIALKIMTFFGGSLNSIVLGFMAASAFLSMWISNTATTIMMLPIALSIITKLEDEFGKERTRNFSITLMIAIAYSCSLGGICTLIGTPPNLALVRILKITFPEAPQISFGSWMLLGIPIAIIMLLFTSFLLTQVFFRYDKTLILSRDFILREYKELGKTTYEEFLVALIFALTAILWIFRVDLNIGIMIVPGWQRLIPNSNLINDGTIAIFMAMLLFILPSKNSYLNKKTLLTVTVFNKIPWGIILLFGGGFALAEGFITTGLSKFIGEKLELLKDFSPIIIIASVAFVMTFLTELTSNTATAQMVLPIMATISVAVGVNPLLLMITATVSASMAFMLPVATPPNTIVFASERIRIIDMAKVGFFMNLFGIAVISSIVYLIGNFLFGLSEFPIWAKP